jgi:hypothetical protein
MSSSRRHSLGLFVIFSACTLLVACASSGWGVQMEPRSVSKRLGEPDCRVSIPLSQAEVLDLAGRWGHPITASRPEWKKMVAEFEPEDQLRLIDCVKAKHNYYFAHIHDDSIITKMYTAILD